ncbi:MAG: HAMP domain-containing sensor histidine kinase, partial [Nautiliaceae bacterium]
MIVLNTPLKEYFSPKYFHPATLSKIANIKMNLQKLLNLQQEVLKEKADISIYNTNFNHVLEQIQIIKNYIKNENDKEIYFIQEKIKYQFKLLIAVTIIFILTNILLFKMIKEKIYKPITYLTKVMKNYKQGIKTQENYFYNDEMGHMIKEFFILQNKLNSKIDELRHHKENLENQVKEEVGKRLHHEKILLQQSRLASMGEMIDAIAHQWKQPLNVISLYNTLLQKSNKPDIGKITSNIQMQIEHMNNTINEFRNFFKKSKEKETFCISETVQKVLLLLKDELNKNQIEVSTKFNPDFCIEGIPNEFKHLLITIINNAKDAFIENGIKERNIKIETKEDENFYYLEISDNAGGIPKEILEKIFDLNFTTKEKGSGIGLYLANQIAIKHTGILEVKNITNGAKFIFKIRKSL